MITTDQFRKGIALKIDGKIYRLLDFQHVKPGKGGAFVRTRLQDLKRKRVSEKTFSAGIRLEDVFIEKKKWQYLYREGDHYHFMDTETFEEIVRERSEVEEVVSFLKENTEVTAHLAEGEPIEIILPVFVELKVVDTEAGLRGDTARAATKFAELETGTRIQVPLFINQGDVVKIDTRTGGYVERK